MQGMPVRDRIVNYLEEAPKKCFFSCFNVFSKRESSLIALKNNNLIKKIVKMWEERENPNETFEEFRKRIHDDETLV